MKNIPLKLKKKTLGKHHNKNRKIKKQESIYFLEQALASVPFELEGTCP